jgi:ferredoxin
MIRDKVIRTLSEPEPINAVRSRCLRMRLNRNECSECITQCPSKAILINEDIRINAGSCSECMICISACPMDVFEISGSDFYSLAGRLRKIPPTVPSAVLGCTARAGSTSHIKSSCLGFLSEEHLIALSFFMQNPLQLNLTECPGCSNGFVMETLEKRISNIESKTAIRLSDNIRMVKSRADLEFHQISYDRREFFKTLKNMTIARAAGLLENEDTDDKVRSYSSRKLPLKRELLNIAINKSAKERSGILNNYFYTITATEACNNCFACVGMCPTGALQIESIEEKNTLVFSSSLCAGCGLCREFCMQKAIRLNKGFSGDNPHYFQHAMEMPEGVNPKETRTDSTAWCCNGF